jgi:glucan endo-1,3-alpha-glucosidase
VYTKRAVEPSRTQHYGPDTYNKNFIYRGDDWLFSQRWELLIQNRQSIDIAQVISWNDFGESHYVGPIQGSQSDSEAWTTGFDHKGAYARCCRDENLIRSLLYQPG